MFTHYPILFSKVRNNNVLLLITIQILFEPHHFYITLFQDPVQATTLHIIVVSPYFGVTVFHSFFVFDDFDSLEEYWSGIL